MPARRCLGGCGALIPSTEERCKGCRSDRDRKRNSESYYQTKEWRDLRGVRRAFDDVCDLCGSAHYVTVHHARGRREGGADELENFPILLCGSCHSRYEAAKRTGRDDSPIKRAVDDLVDALMTEPPPDIPEGGIQG